jgi:hypothetical protein
MSAKLLQQIFKKLYGKPSWNVQGGWGSFITFDFGNPKLEVLKKVFKPSKGRKYPQRYAHIHGEWHLWIYCCDWVIRQDGRKVGDSTSKEKINRGCSVLGGQYLTKVVVNPKNWQTDFYFDLGGHLQTKPYKKEDEPSEIWKLRCPDGRWFRLRADGKFSHQSGNTTPDKEVWQPFII